MPGRDARRNQRPIWAAMTALLLTGMITSLFLAARAKQSAEATATSRAQVAVQEELAPLLTSSDAAQPVTGERYQTLSALVTRRLLSTGPSDGVTIYSPDATIVFDVERGRVGERAPELRARIERVLGQGRESVVQGDAFHAFVPLRLKPVEDPLAVVDVMQPYEPLWSSASKPWRVAAIGFAALLIPAFGMLVLSFRGAFGRSTGGTGWGRAVGGARAISGPAVRAPEASMRPAGNGGGVVEPSPVYEHPGYRAEVEGRRNAEERAARAEEAAEAIRREIKQLKQASAGPDVAAVAQMQLKLAEAEEHARATEAERDEVSEKLRRTEYQRGELFERLDVALEELAESKQQQTQAIPIGDPELEARAARAEERAAAAESALRLAEDAASRNEAGRRSAEEQAAAAREEAAALQGRMADAERGRSEAEVRALAAESDAESARREGAGTRDERLAAAEERAERARVELADAGARLAASEERAAKAEDMTHVLGERVRAAEDRVNEASERVREAKEALRNSQQRTRDAERDAAVAKERADSIEADAQRGTDRALTAERALANAIERLDQATERARLASDELATAQEQGRISAEAVADMQERVRLADERAEADRGDAITAAERAAFAEQEVTSVREQLALAQEQVRASQAEAVEAGTRAEQAEEHLRVVAQERRAEAEAAKALAEEQPQLQEVLRITKERLHRSGERLQETEARARAAEHDLESARQRTEELEGTMRREKLHDALQHLRGDDQPVHAPPIEERRAAAPFMKALSLDARNSVAAIQGLVLAMKHAEKADEQPAMLRKLNAHARKLDRLVGDLLDADRLARGDVELKVRRTDIEALAKRVLEECAFDGDRNIEIRSEKVVVAVDPIRVEGIIVALLNNAVDRSRPRHEITVRVAAKDDGALISVEDEEPSSDASLSPVVARFADVHGGWATVESRQGGGSAFRVFLPGEGARTAHTTIAPERDTIEIRDSAAAELSAEAPGA
jgi:hypothetical protein